jgi:hypothetical protein
MPLTEMMLFLSGAHGPAAVDGWRCFARTLVARTRPTPRVGLRRAALRPASVL